MAAQKLKLPSTRSSLGRKLVARELYYFDDFGTQNTKKTIEAAKTVALNLGLKYARAVEGYKR